MADQNKGQGKGNQSQKKGHDLDHIVLDQHVFANVFDKDIRRVYIYKKAERLAKAIHLVAPAFTSSPALKDKIDNVSVCLVDSSVCNPGESRTELSRQLLILSSVLSIAKSSGLLSPMNADIVSREAQHLLQEVAAYEEPRLTLPESPQIAQLLKGKPSAQKPVQKVAKATPVMSQGQSLGQAPEAPKTGRKEAIVSVLRSKGPSYIKDISLSIRDVSEKTIQRELQSLVLDGTVLKNGDRRWTTYRLANPALPASS